MFEIICAVGFAPAFVQPYGYLVAISALAIAAAMVVFCILHLASGAQDFKPMIYWIVVALVCGFVAYGRMVLIPF